MNLYMVLGVAREASDDEIKRAYKRLARRFHPNVNPGDADAARVYREVVEAFETLSHPERRRAYDSGAFSEVHVTASVAFEGFDFTQRADGSQASTFGDLFGEVMHARVRRQEPERGADLHERLALSFEQAMRGATVGIRLTRLEPCGPCAGRGAVAGPEVRCYACDGAGHVRGTRGHMVFARACSACGGGGTLRVHVCQACGGEGVGVRADIVPVDIPPGVRDATELTVPGQGHAGRRGGGPGDLRLAIHVESHRFFRRDGDDVVIDVPLAVHEAALGTRVPIPSPDGPVVFRVPPGTQSGQRFRVRERGIRFRHGQRGDLIADVRIVLPTVIDERSKELLREFGTLQTDNVRAHFGELTLENGPRP